MHRIEVELRASAAIVHAEGELDAYAAPELSECLEGIAGSRYVVANLAAVSFMDSTALGLVVRAVRELTESGAAVRVVLPGGTARRIFEITTLDRVLPLAPTADAALAELVPSAGSG